MIVRGDARRLPLADSTVDLIVTSPPYFALRSYQDGGEHYAGQIGDEPTPAEFVDALLDVTRECVRVLKPSGSLWVNLGDKYASYEGNRGRGGAVSSRVDPGRNSLPGGAGLTGGGVVRNKSLIGVPWRYALRCVDELGLILRAEVIWSKPNGLPESVTDRVRRSHETWFHFTREPRYYSAADTIREEFSSGTGWIGRATQERANVDRNDGGKVCTTANPLGKLPGSVWTIPTSPLTVPEHLGVDHFAAFPPEWPRRIILGWSPDEVCTACQQPRCDVWEDVGQSTYARLKAAGDMMLGRDVGAISEPGNSGQTKDGTGKAVTYEAKARRKVGRSCACPEPSAPTRPAVVLDPFSGTGTTAMVARALGRTGIGVDLSADYCKLGQWRSSDLAQHAKVRGEEFRKDTPQADGQVDLFDLLEQEAVG